MRSRKVPVQDRVKGDVWAGAGRFGLARRHETARDWDPRHGLAGRRAVGTRRAAVRDLTVVVALRHWVVMVRVAARLQVRRRAGAGSRVTLRASGPRCRARALGRRRAEKPRSAASGRRHARVAPRARVVDARRGETVRAAKLVQRRERARVADLQARPERGRGRRGGPGRGRCRAEVPPRALLAASVPRLDRRRGRARAFFLHRYEPRKSELLEARTSGRVRIAARVLEALDDVVGRVVMAVAGRERRDAGAVDLTDTREAFVRV